MRALAFLAILASPLACGPNGGTTDAGTTTDDSGTTTVSCDGGTISISADAPSCLWAPNHDMVVFDLSNVKVTTTGNCTAPTLSIVSVTSNQPDTGGGQGNFSPDYKFDDDTVCLLAERQGSSSSDRVYSITIQATDGVTTIDQVVTITVPHDQSGTKCPSSAAWVAAPNDPRCAF